MGMLLRRYHTEDGHVAAPGDVEAADEHQTVDEQGVDDLEHAAERPGEDQSTPFDPDAEPTNVEGEQPDTGEPDDNRPAGNASTDEWRAYAVSKGMDPAEADGLSRDELRDRYTA